MNVQYSMPARVAFYFWTYPNPNPRARKASVTSWRMSAHEARARFGAAAQPSGDPEWRDIPLPGEPVWSHNQRLTAGMAAERAGYPLLMPGDPGHPDND